MTNRTEQIRSSPVSWLSVRRAASGTALTATLGLAAVCWVVALQRMNGMDMGTETKLGSFGFFIGVWLVMMGAMMLPGAAPAVLRRGQAGGGAGAVSLFVGSYLAVWSAAGLAVYVLYRPHSSVAAGAVVIAAGVYELTPLKRYFRHGCFRSASSGLDFGIYCVGSSIGLMLMMVVLGVMSVTWMIVTTAVVFAQKLLPPRAAVDVPLALAIIGFGIAILIAPSTIPGLVPPM
jgi:predicted metal-binding membrane protein